MLHDLANDGGFVALRWAAEDIQGWRQRKDVKNLLYSRRLLTTNRQFTAFWVTFGHIITACAQKQLFISIHWKF